MSNPVSTITPNSVFALQWKQNSRFRVRGISLGIMSGLTYGLFGATVAFAMSGFPFSGLTGNLATFGKPLVAAGINDTIAFFWLMLYLMINGRIREVGRSLFTFPGLMVAIAGVLGGPIASGAYLIGIANAGPSAIPVAVLYPVFGALFGRMFLRQKLGLRIIVGMIICIAGAIWISYEKPVETYPNFLIGMTCAFIAAAGWGLEGVFAAFGGSMIDSESSVSIREGVSSVVYIFIIFPVLGFFDLFTTTLSVGHVMWIFALCATLQLTSALTWYKSNSMIGVATAGCLNITSVIFGVFFSALLLNVTITNVMMGAIVMILAGAMLVSFNPLDMFKKKGVLQS